MPISALIRSGLANSNQSTWWKSLSGYTLGEAARLVPEISSLTEDAFPVQTYEGPGAQTRFYNGIVQTLFALAAQNSSAYPSQEEPPGLVFLDDMHWADTTSIEILNLVLHRLIGRKIMILVAWQDIETESTRHLKLITTRIFRENLGKVIHLQRLNESQVRNLILYSESIGNPLDPKWCARISQESEGNPFFLTAYLQALLNDSIEGETGQQSIPETIIEMVRSRLAYISPAGRQILQTAAVIGRSFEFQTLHEASGRAEDESIFALEELVAHGLVKELRDGSPQIIRYDFSHDKIRWIVFQDISLARLRLLNRRIAESLEQQQHGHSAIQTGQLSGRIANHYRQAAETEKAAYYYRQAGEFARKVFANHEALAHFETALALGYRPKRDIYLSIGDMHVLNGDYKAAIVSFETAASQEDQIDSLSSFLAYAEWKIGLVYDRLGEWDQALAQFSAAEKKLSANALVDRSQLFSDWSLACHHRGDSQTAEKLAEEALHLASLAGDLQALARIHNLLGILSRHRGNLLDAKNHIEQSVELAELSGQPEIQVAAMNNLARQRQESGDIDAAIELATQALSVCKCMGDRHHEAAIHNHLADLYQSIGRGDEALEQLKLAVAIFAEIGEEAGHWWPEVWKLMEW
jgi:predicted ATPase